MATENLVHLVDAAPGKQPRALAKLIERVSHSPIRRALSKMLVTTPSDPYLLILLADQELMDGREQQAACLVEAAYEAFDRETGARVFPLHLTG